MLQKGRLRVPWRGRISRLVIGALVLTGGLVTASAGAASAEEVFVRPANGVWTISGHGFGHGRGMSQWGAYGAATLGKSSQQILAGYYPGTTAASVANDPIRVRLTGADTASLRVSRTDGLTIVESTGARTALPVDRDQWRVLPSAAGLQLQGLIGGAWSAFPLGSSTGSSTSLRFEGSSGLLRVWRADNTSIAYRGAVSALPAGTGAVSTVLTLPLESYLRGVVPRESPASWPGAALQSQSVAARTYAVSAVRRSGSAASDICDTTSCQVFSGTTSYTASGAATALEYASTDAAVAATSGVVLTYQGAMAFTEFSASNGGWSSAGSQPYLAAQADPWDGAAPGDSVHSWQASLPASALEASNPSIGTLQRLVVTGRDGNGDWGGRVTSVRLEGSAGTVTTTGAAIRNARPYPSYGDGLRSTWWTVDDVPPIGSFDGANYVGGSTVRVSGWALDPNTPNPVTVHVTVDGALVAAGTAASARPDVGAAYPGLGNSHGFDLAVPVGGGSHQVCVHALNSGATVYSQRLACRGVALPGPGVPAQLLAGAPPVVSANAGFWLSMQGDGNVVVYDSTGRARWATMTSLPGSYLKVQSDGNVVLYDPQGLALWTTGVYSPGATLQMQGDGNLVLYAASGAPLWDSQGVTRHAGTFFAPKRPVPSVASGASVSSYGGGYTLTMQTSGNLVLTAASGARVWASGSQTPGATLKAQTDGNVVIYAPSGKPVWHTNIYSPGDHLVLQDDGNLVMYDAAGRPLWDSNGFTGHPAVLVP